MIMFLSAGLIAYSYFEIRSGLPAIAAQVPSHGVPGAITASLWISLFVEIFLTGTLLVVPWISRAYPEAVHFGVRRMSDYTPEQRERIMPLLKQMMGMMSGAYNLFSGMGIHMRIQDALWDPRRRPNLWWMAGALVSLGAITYYYVRRFDEEASGG
ncbi:MAG TPA: hypothetical protein VKR61_08005 [Bryobacteraceae bacterium]|nr:hypothetical protein [Bryobacteraceae bacterium]